MPTLPAYHRRLLVLLALACALVDAGCAGLRCPRCPRIDPSGERCLIWPKDEAAVATVPPPATVFPAATASLPTVPGNTTAPPVLTDPVFPQPELPAVASAAPGVPIAPVSTQVATEPQDRLTISPERMLAPVGSEVVLKGNICTTEGYTLAEQKIEWMLGRNGVGEFVEVSGKGAFHPSIYPWNKGSKTDNYLATSYTANGPHCIDRGTPDPSDDVGISRGDAWVSVTSASEGTSHVTAYTESVDSWPLRKQMATIYWVDVQWVFPPAAVTSGGRETLTTVVKRQTDGAPLAGWIVRYEVSDGLTTAAGAGQVSEVVTDAQGMASVQVSPTAAGAASSKIDMQLVRPANFGGGDAPRLVIGNSSTIVNWSGGSTYLPPSGSSPLTPVTPSTPVVPAGPPITTIPSTPPPATTTPSQPAGPPRLEVTLQAPQTAQVGGKWVSTVTIRNVGGSPATNVVLTDRFDVGLYHVTDPALNMIRNDRVGTIAPGESRQFPIELQVSKAGSLCQDVTAEYTGGNPASQRACVSATAPAAPSNASFRIDVEAPSPVVQGQNLPVRITIRNTGEVALSNVRMVEEYPLAAMIPQPAEAGVQVISGRISRDIGMLPVGAVKEFRVNCGLKTATRATIFAQGEAYTDTGARISTADSADVDITAATGAQPGAGGTPGAASGAATLAIGVQLGTASPRAGGPSSLRVGAPTNCEIMVRNTGSTPQTNLGVRVFLPAQLTPNLNAISGSSTSAQIVDGAIQFATIPTINAGEAVRFVIPVNPTAAVNATVIAEAISSGQQAPAQKTQTIEILENRF
ncbi:DUF11 domain-containing protein [Lacipirellula parvula]|uniref:DUF11 domain-containing protein n=1 Tax=Lacipirellula parvula TaxID=2650471 RepID=A0A5K7XCM5_9BACT|nr:DUF11 domain-containing protein [Lacipirellula parvula]BBO32136.1 hypothetical protein PLANPX_1748 [Lacipirellula parvula]